MKLTALRHQFSLLLISLLFFGCDQIGRITRGNLDEGVVTYNVKFPSMDPESVTFDLMPQQLTKSFKGHLTRIDFNVGHGLMKSSFISNAEDRSMIILLELFGAKYATVETKEKTSITVSEMPKFKLEFVSESKKIANYDCKKVIVSDLNGDFCFYIYYTDEIEGGDLNWDNPFREIQGMIMEYPLVYRFSDHVLDMDLEAAKVESKQVRDVIFKIPKGYEMVSKYRIDQMLGDLMSMGT